MRPSIICLLYLLPAMQCAICQLQRDKNHVKLARPHTVLFYEWINPCETNWEFELAIERERGHRRRQKQRWRHRLEGRISKDRCSQALWSIFMDAGKQINSLFTYWKGGGGSTVDCLTVGCLAVRMTKWMSLPAFRTLAIATRQRKAKYNTQRHEGAFMCVCACMCI